MNNDNDKPDALTTRLRALVIDDEKDVREMLGEALELNHFDVTMAGSGQAALDIIDSQDLDFDLIILDMSMPGMTGKEVYHELIKRHVSSKIVIASGYTEDEIVDLISQAGSGDEPFAGDFMQKPFLYVNFKKVLDKLFSHE